MSQLSGIKAEVSCYTYSSENVGCVCLAFPKPHIMSGDPNRVQFSFFFLSFFHTSTCSFLQFPNLGVSTVAINNNHLLFHSNFMRKAHCPKAVFPQIHRCKATEGREQSVNIVWISWARQEDNSPVPMCCVFSLKRCWQCFLCCAPLKSFMCALP